MLICVSLLVEMSYVLALNKQAKYLFTRVFEFSYTLAPMMNIANYNQRLSIEVNDS